MARRGSGQRGQITISDVRAALAEAYRTGKRITLRDGQVPGALFRAGKRGGVWSLEYKSRGARPDGRPHGSKYFILGSADALSPDDAQRLAAQAKHRLLLGEDLHQERREAQAKAVAPGYAEVAGDYLVYLQRRLRQKSYATETSALRKAFSILDPSEPLRAIDARKVAYLLDRLPVLGAVAVHTLGSLGRLLDWARSRGIVDADYVNPVRSLPRGARPRKPLPRQRVLSATELVALWHGAAQLASSTERDLLRLIIALPLRRSEAWVLRWEWIDHAANTITLPAATMKGGEAHTIPCGALARVTLNAIAGGDEWPSAGRLFARSVQWHHFKLRIDSHYSPGSSLGAARRQTQLRYAVG
jgi:integrase